MRSIGLHIRINTTLSDAIEKAIRMNMGTFQCFLIRQKTGLLLRPDYADIKRYRALRREYFGNLFFHGSYAINLASVQRQLHYSLQRELALAQRLEFTHMVLHAGSAKGGTKAQGIESLVRVLNDIMHHQDTIKIVLENTAHGNASVGSDITDFTLILQKLDFPDRVAFCIDTAHAHSFGYDLSTKASQQTFIDLIDNAIGLERIALLHVNDTHQSCGSKADQHCVVGQGLLGFENLCSFAMHPRLATVPCIMELPEINEEQEQVVINTIKNYRGIMV